MTELAGLRVMVVEDEPLITLLIEGMLDELGCSVVGTAGTVSQAIDFIEKHDFDLAFLDVNLAGKQVFPVAATLREQRRPFIFSSGYGRDGIPEEFSDAPVIPKPFRIEELDAAIRSVVSIS